MTKILIEIKGCKECPFVDISRDYTADSWEHCEKYVCKKQHNKIIERYVDWNEKVAVPDRCPIKVEEKQ